MAIIPRGQQIRTTSASVNLTNRGNSLVQAQNHVYTMDDIVDTVITVSATAPSNPVTNQLWLDIS